MDTPYFNGCFLSNSGNFTTLTSGAFHLIFLFEKSRLIVCKKCWLTKDCSGGFMKPPTSPGKNTVKRNSQGQFRRKVWRIGDFFREQIQSCDRRKVRAMQQTACRKNWQTIYFLLRQPDVFKT